jgi:hypothetical protein
VHKFIRHFGLPIVAVAVAAGLITAANVTWPHSSDNPYANWPTQAGTPAAGMQAELFPSGNIPHPNMMVIFTCTPQGMKVDQRSLVGTDQKPSWYASIFRDAAYSGKGLCSAIWRWQIPEKVAYTGNFTSELKPEASWSETVRGWSALPGDGDAFVEPGKVQVMLVEVHDKDLPLGEPIHTSADGAPVPPMP